MHFGASESGTQTGEGSASDIWRPSTSTTITWHCYELDSLQLHGLLCRKSRIKGCDDPPLAVRW